MELIVVDETTETLCLNIDESKKQWIGGISDTYYICWMYKLSIRQKKRVFFKQQSMSFWYLWMMILITFRLTLDIRSVNCVKKWRTWWIKWYIVLVCQSEFQKIVYHSYFTQTDTQSKEFVSVILTTHVPKCFLLSEHLYCMIWVLWKMS